MPKREIAGQLVEVDAAGFLLDALAWTPAIAEDLARAHGIERLTPRHWKVISSCREAAARAGKPPSLVQIARLAAVGVTDLRRLFAPRPEELIARLAGLSEPIP